MPIALLPDSTVRAIGSSLVLYDACSVVKELVDNALDASASSITVEISQDTLDVLQVKDNGHGIGVEDRQLVCKRGCTSKIRTMQDLENLGGSSLGFRGEALACVAELSEAVTLTTRVNEEVVATTLRFRRNGTLQSSASASHPVGTTFRIQGFLQAIPVRKEAAKKAASRTLAAIKKLLYSYAFARPSVRFAFKVLRANNEKANWSYGPKIGLISFQDTTAKILGQELTAQCELRSAELRQVVPDSVVEESYTVDALLVKLDADSSKIHNVGHYLSVDGRPVNPTRGIAKDVVKLYKSFYRTACGDADRTSSINPFIYMHIRCPLASYDVNIEPAKDDMLFSEPSKVMALADKLFKDYYGELASDADTRTRPPMKRQAVATADDTFDLWLARKLSGMAEQAITTRPTDTTPLQADFIKLTGVTDAPPLAIPLGGIDVPLLESEPSSVHQRDSTSPRQLHAKDKSNGETSKPHFNMYGVDEDDIPLTEFSGQTQPSPVGEVDGDEVGSARVTNPWSLAKLNAPTRRGITHPIIQADSSAAIQLMTPESGRNSPARDLQRPSPQRDLKAAKSNLPSPGASSPSPAAYQNPGPPLRRRACNDQQTSDDDDIESTQGLVNEIPNARHANTLDTWARPQEPTMDTLAFSRASILYNTDGSLGGTGKTHFERRFCTSDSPSSTQLTEPYQTGGGPLTLSNNVWKPFKSPFKRQSATSAPAPQARLVLHDPSPPSGQRSVGMGNGNPSSLMPPPPSPSQRAFKLSQTPSAELAEMLEFEERKKAAISHQRRSQSSRSHGELNPANLARVQRKVNDRSLLPVVPSQIRRSLPSLDLREEQTNPARVPEREFVRSSDEEAARVMHRSSPHGNRYLAAKERLADSHLENDHVVNPGQPSPMTSDAEDLLKEADVRISEDDPRSYLAQHSGKGKETTSSTGLTKTGLKIRRTKTARLPLETIPADAAVHDLKATPSDPFPGTPALTMMGEHQGRFDDYVRAGQNSFVRWSPNSRDVALWETTLKGLIAKSFEARLVGGAVVAPEVGMVLTTAIKAHADAHGL